MGEVARNVPHFRAQRRDRAGDRLANGSSSDWRPSDCTVARGVSLFFTRSTAANFDEVLSAAVLLASFLGRDQLQIGEGSVLGSVVLVDP